MTDRVILTDRREELLEEGYDTEDQSDRNAMSRFRQSTRTALDELTEIAESPQIDNTEVFEVGDVFRFIRALNTPDECVLIDEEPPESFQHYQHKLHAALGRLVLEEYAPTDTDD